eukprot:jgi/Hompol1/3407/HPOL_006535-RA
MFSAATAMAALRFARWEALNTILAKNKNSKARGSKNSTAYSSVTLAEIKSIYDPITKIYDLNAKPVPEETIDSLHSYLAKSGRVFGSLTTGNEAQLLHFIAPVLVHVCDLFNGDVKILVDETMDGKDIDVNGRFEFVLQRNDKRICIVPAKRDNFEQGIAQDLLGCEAVADMERLDCVYGIVTNYVEWVFIKNCNDKIEQITSSLSLETGQVPSRASLEMIAGKIYAMLS